MELLSRYAPTYEELNGLRPEWHRIDFDRDYPVLGQYYLCERVPSGPDDACYYAVTRGLAGFTKPCFLRRFPAALLTEPRVDGLRQRAAIVEPGIESVYDIGAEGEWGFLMCEFIEGLSVAALQAELEREGRTLPWGAALALLHDAGRRLDMLHRKTCRHGALTPARVRISLRGMVYLCNGVPGDWQPPPVPPAQRDADNRALLAAVLSLALPPDRRAQVPGILATDDPGALGVLCDLLLERSAPPEALFAALVDRFPETDVTDWRPAGPDSVLFAVGDSLLPEDARALWRLVLDRSPDMRGGYEPLGEPR